MKLQAASFLVTLILLLSAALAWSQTGASESSQSSSSQSSSSQSSSSQSGFSQSSSAESSPQQTPSDGPQPVFTHPEELPPLATLGEVAAHSYINLGLGTGVSWESNAAGFSTQSYSRALFTVNPTLQLKQTRPTLMWFVAASGWLSVSDSSQTSYNSSSPTASGGVLYQLSRRWQVSANDTYIYTADPFRQYLVYSAPPTYNQPNPTVYVPQATTEANTAELDLTYQITAHDSLTFTGTESFNRYLHTYSPYDFYSWGGVASYQHQISAKLSAGGAYSYSALDFGHGQSRSGVQLFQGFASYAFSPHLHVSGWIGPEYTTTKNLVPILCTPYGCFIEVAHFQTWDTSFGGSLGWSGARNAFTASISKSISNGGILLGIVQLYQVHGRFTRQLTPRWNLNLGVLYGNNTGYSTRLHTQHLDSFTGNAGLLRQITPALSVNLQYTYFYQTQQHVFGASAPKWIDNNFQFLLQYTWGHSLGR